MDPKVGCQHRHGRNRLAAYSIGFIPSSISFAMSMFNPRPVCFESFGFGIHPRHPSRFLPSALSTTFVMDFRLEGPLSRPRAWRARAIFSCSHLASFLLREETPFSGRQGRRTVVTRFERLQKDWFFFFSSEVFFVGTSCDLDVRLWKAKHAHLHGGKEVAEGARGGRRNCRKRGGRCEPCRT